MSEQPMAFEVGSVLFEDRRYITSSRQVEYGKPCLQNKYHEAADTMRAVFKSLSVYSLYILRLFVIAF